MAVEAAAAAAAGVYNLAAALGIGQTPELVAMVGGGGKTSLLFALGRMLPGRVVMTTTTRIFAAQMKLATAVCLAADLSSLTQKLDTHGRVLVVGEVAGEKAFGVPPDLPARLLARPDVDHVLVEADGSRMRPIKAPAAHEPVIPPETTLVVPVAGIDALAAPLAQAAHRPELVLALIGHVSAAMPQRLTEADIATLLVHPQGGMKGVPEKARVIPLLNKVQTTDHLRAARQIARHILCQRPTAGRIPQVVIGAVKTEQPVREVQRRVTAVILAAGESKRMGQPKQLLPWGDSTVLGQTIRHVQAATVHEIMVVSGYEAEKVEAIATAAGVVAVHNAHYATGEMLSSLQTGVRHLLTSPLADAILVMLADQPMVTAATLDELLAAYWRGEGDLVAPVYNGRRGNPVLIGRRYFAELLALPPGEAPRALLQRHPSDLVLCPVSTDAVVQDLDSPEVYERLRPS